MTRVNARIKELNGLVGGTIRWTVVTSADFSLGSSTTHRHGFLNTPKGLSSYVDMWEAKGFTVNRDAGGFGRGQLIPSPKWDVPVNILVAFEP